MNRKTFWTTGLVLIAGLSMAANGFTFQIARTDCPGTILCPITGDEVCKDHCPLVDASRSDCPGKVACPITGEFVCQDECPLAQGDATQTTSADCCRLAQ